MQTLQIAGGMDDAIDDFQEQELATASRGANLQQSNSTRTWTTRALDSTVCCACLLVLSPAIIAVWIAIRRCGGPAARAITRKDVATPQDSPLLIVLKPERLRNHSFVEKSSVGIKPAIVTHATL